MNSEKIQIVKKIFEEALEIDSEKREEFLDKHCPDEEIKNEILILLKADEQSTDFLKISQLTDKNNKDSSNRNSSFIGKRVGKYLIVDEAGAGGMGIVYRGKRDDKEFEHNVAVKILRHHFHSDYILKRFQNERQTLANLQHPNIARLLDGGTTDDGLPYLVMEYIDGSSIVNYCNDNDLTVKQRLKLFIEVCKSIQYAHQNLVIHRDIKPGNVLVDKNGRPKLFDFGIAKLMDEEQAEEDGGLTKTGVWHLTPEYASPEQIRGDNITTATDIYSLGVLLYEILTGAQPYKITNHSPVVINKIVTEKIVLKPSDRVKQTSEYEINGSIKQNVINDPEKVAQQLKGDLDNIVLKAMSKEPSRRYFSVEQFSEDIKKYLMGMPVIARKDTLTYRVSKFIKRHKIAIAVFMIVNIIIISGIVAIIHQSNVAEEERDKAQLEALKSDRINEFLQQMLASANPRWYIKGKVKGPEVTIVEVLDEAARRLETEMNDQPEVKADLHLTIGDTYLSLEKFELAKPHFEAAYKLRSDLFAADDPKAIETLFYLAIAQRTQNDYDAAEQTYRKAITLYKLPKNSGNPYLPHTLDALGYMLLTKKYDPISAEPVLREALHYFRIIYGDDHPTTAYGMQRLSTALIISGKFKEAESLLNHSKVKIKNDTSDLLSDKEIKSRLIILNNLLGKLYLKTGRYAEAKSHLFESLVLIENNEGNNIGLADNNFYLGSVFNAIDELNNAEQYLETALNIYETNSDSSYEAHLVRIELGKLFYKQGKFKKAEQTLLQGYNGLQNSPDGYPDFIKSKKTASELIIMILEKSNRTDEAEKFQIP